MTDAAYRDRESGRYPISLSDVRSAVNMLFGEEPTQDVLDAANVDQVLAVDPPLYDPATHSIEEGPPEFAEGAWRQKWSLTLIPTPPVPTITMRQAKIQLSRAGLLIKANAAIDALDGQLGEEARLEWEYATSLRRDHPLVAGIGAALGLDDAAKDDLFRQAALIP